MTADFSWMVGRRVKRITFFEPARWFFALGDRGSISADCPWRVIEVAGIAVSGDDHGQQFGLPAPIDAAARALSLLADRAIFQVDLREPTADLAVSFDGGIRLEIVPFSSGYESWQVVDPSGRTIVAQGGGRLVSVNP